VSIGESGRVVVEIEPLLKRELHSALLKDGKTLKKWFVTQAEDYLRNCGQATMFSESISHEKVVSNCQEESKNA